MIEQTAQTREGGSSRTLPILVTALTGIGLVGVLVEFVAFFAIHGPSPLAWAYVYGVSADVSGAMTPAPQLVATHVGCGA